MKKFLIEIKARWGAESPLFWKKVLNITKWVVGTAGAVWAANSALNLNLDPVIVDVMKYTIAFGVATGLNAKITKTDG